MLTSLFNRFLRKSNSDQAVALAEMTNEEREVVRRFAGGDESARDQAITIYRAARERGVTCEREAAMRFMFEVDHSNPDIVLRRMMREEVLRTPAG